MAGDNEIKKAEIGLGPSDESFQGFQRLQSMLTGVFDQLIKIQGAARNIKVDGVTFSDPDKGNAVSMLAGLQKDLRTILSAVQRGNPNAQFNSAILSNQQASVRYGDNRVDLESTRIANAEAERRVMLQKQLNLSQEAQKVYATEQIGLTREIAQVTERAAAAQERMRNALIASDEVEKASATRQIRDARTRLDQLQEELSLRERGAKIRLGNALDAGGDANTVNAQLAAIQVGRTQLQDAQRLVAAAPRRAESAANSAIRQTQAPINSAWNSANAEDRKRYVDDNIAAGKVGLDRTKLLALRDAAEAAQQAADEAEQAALNKQGSKHGPTRDQILALRDKAEAAQQALDAAEQEALNKEGAKHGPTRADVLKLRDRADALQQAADEAEQQALNKQGAKHGPSRAQLLAMRDKADAAQQKADEAEQEMLNREGAKQGPDRKRFYELRDKAWAQQQKDDDNFEKMLRQAQVENKKWEEAQLKQQGASQSDAQVRQRRYNTTFGDGGASIAATQTALTANYMVTQGVMSAFKSAIQYTTEYEEALAHLHTIAGATDGQMVQLKGTIESVSDASRYSAVDLTKAAAALSETGVTTSQMGAALRGVADLATATGEDFNKTVDTVTGALGSFKMSATDTVEVTNMIAQAVNTSRLTMDKLKTSIETTGETASEAGVSFKEMLAANVAITNTGTASGATLGGGLRQLLTDLEKPSASFKAILAQVGLTEDDINVKTQGLYGAMKNLKDAGFTASDAMQSFQARSASAFTALSGNLGEMERFEQSLNNTDAATKANADQMDTLGAQYDRFKSQTSLVIGEAFTPLLFGFKELLKATSDLEAETRSANGTVEVLGTVLGGAALAGASKYVGSLIGGLAGMATGGFEAAAGLAAIGGEVGLMIGVVAAAAAGVGYFIHTLSDSNKAFDDQRTIINAAKDALKESEQGMDSVGRQIDTLSHKMVSLNEHPALLKQEIDDVSKTFEKYGEQLDVSAIKKTEDLIEALQRLHGQMGQRYELNTNILAGQLDLGLELTKKKLGETSRSFSAGAFDGPHDKIDAVLGGTPLVSGAEAGIAPVGGRSFNVLPNGNTSKGGVSLDQGLTLDNLPSLVTYLRDIGGKNVDSFDKGARQALGANGKPQTQAEAEAARALIDGADGALNSARQTITARYNDKNTSPEERKRIDAIDQLLSNLTTQLKPVLENTQLLVTTFSDQKKVAGDAAQIAYEKGAGPSARAAGVSQLLLNAERVLTSGSRQNRSLDDLWTAQTMAESGRHQFDKDGHPLTSSKGAVGVAQVMEETGPEAAAAAGVDWDRNAWMNDAAYNEKIGKAYMGKLMKKYNGNNTLALAGYNWGQGNVDDTLKSVGDFRNPASGITEMDWTSHLPPKTQAYISRIGGGSGAGPMGQFYSLQNNRDMSNSAKDVAALVSQLETARKQAHDDNNPQEEKSVTTLLDKAKATLAEFESKYNSTREAAAPALRKVSQSDARALDAQLNVVNKQINRSTNVDEIQAGALDAQSLITSKYEEQIATLKKTSAITRGADGSMNYSADVVKQIDDLQKELAAKLQAQDDAVKHHLEVVTEAAANAELKTRMKKEELAFSTFMKQLTSDDKARSTDTSVQMRRNGQPLRDDASQAGYMNDPRYSAQFSQVQRQSLTFKQAADQDLKDQADLATKQQDRLQLEAEMARAAAERSTISGNAGTLQGKLDGLTGDDASTVAERGRVQTQLNAALKDQSTLDVEIQKIEGEQKKNAEDRLELEGKINAKKATPVGLGDGIMQANENYIKMHDETATALDGYNNMIATTQSNLSSFFDTILTGSKSAGDAMKAFAVSFLKSILQIMEQQAALQVVKSILGLFVPSGGGDASAGADVQVGGPMDMGGGTSTPLEIQGGFVNAGGTITHSGGVQRFATGGRVPGGVSTRDSVHALLQPGEEVMNTGAVAAVGEDFLNNLNAQGNRVVSKGTPAPKPEREKQPQHVNVWVVAPDQKPQMGPQDIVATISDDIARGGTTKQLIKQVAMGQA
jgi:TP901 family phage tail tape measure protein